MTAGVPNVGMMIRVKTDVKTFLSGDITNTDVQATAVTIATNAIVNNFGYASDTLIITANSLTIGDASALVINVGFVGNISPAFEVIVLPVDLVQNQVNPIQYGDED